MAYTFSWVPTPGQNNSFVTNNNGTGRAIVNAQQSPFNSPLYICIPPITFQGGDAGATTLYDFAKTIATCGLTTTVQNPAINYNGNRFVGGLFTLNGNPCGRYEYNVLAGGTTLTQAMVATLFSSSLDISTWIVVRGNLTIGSGVTLIPNVNPSYTAPATVTSPDPDAKRRLFMVVYVTGTLTFADSTSVISITACGGNSSSTGANIGSFNVPIANNLYFGLDTNINPTIQSVGAAGGAPSTGGSGITGDNPLMSPDGSSLSTGGGGSGLADVDGGLSGAGGSGSVFSGGTGGGSASKGNTAPSNASSLGGTGGYGSEGSTAGGTGNPGGLGDNGGLSGLSGSDGTGGIVIIISEGTITGNGGAVRANGVDSVAVGDQAGGASGGGIVAIIKSTSSSTNLPSMQISGGVGAEVFGFNTGGYGGSGSAYNYGINS